MPATAPSKSDFETEREFFHTPPMHLLRSKTDRTNIILGTPKAKRRDHRLPVALQGSVGDHRTSTAALRGHPPAEPWSVPMAASQTPRLRPETLFVVAAKSSTPALATIPWRKLPRSPRCPAGTSPCVGARRRTAPVLGKDGPRSESLPAQPPPVVIKPPRLLKYSLQGLQIELHKAIC